MLLSFRTVLVFGIRKPTPASCLSSRAASVRRKCRMALKSPIFPRSQVEADPRRKRAGPVRSI